MRATLIRSEYVLLLLAALLSLVWGLVVALYVAEEHPRTRASSRTPAGFLPPGILFSLHRGRSRS